MGEEGKNLKVHLIEFNIFFSHCRLFELKETVYKDHASFRPYVPEKPSIVIDSMRKTAHATLLDGHFISPLVALVPGAMPSVCDVARSIDTLSLHDMVS